MIISVERFHSLPMGDVNVWKEISPYEEIGWVRTALIEQGIGWQSRRFWSKISMEGFTNLALFPKGAFFITAYYKKKYGIDITPCEMERSAGGAAILKAHALGKHLGRPGRFWVILLRMDRHCSHWIPILLRRREGGIDGVILDSTGAILSEERREVQKVASSYVPVVNWCSRGDIRQRDWYSCGIDALILSKDILRKEPAQIDALVDDLICGKKEVFSSFARGVQDNMDKYRADQMVLRGKKKGPISLGEHFAKYRRDVAKKAECAKNVDGKPSADPSDIAFGYGPFREENTFLWVKAKKYAERMPKYEAAVAASTSSGAAEGGRDRSSSV